MFNTLGDTSKYLLSEEFDNDYEASFSNWLQNPAKETKVSDSTEQNNKKTGSEYSPNSKRTDTTSGTQSAKANQLTFLRQRSNISLSQEGVHGIHSTYSFPSIPNGSITQSKRKIKTQEQQWPLSKVAILRRNSSSPRLASLQDTPGTRKESPLLRKRVLQKSVSKVKPMEKFRSTALRVVNALRFLHALTGHQKGYQQSSTSFAQLQQDIEENFQPTSSNSNGFVFDRNYFKAVKDVTLTTEAVRVLSKDPETRTEEEIQMAMHALKASNPSFKEYPPKMQIQLVSKGWYGKFESKRVIIRQGHQPMSFYFIISGAAIVSIYMKDKTTGEGKQTTVAVLSKGNSFGELALLHNRTRTATVTCKTDMSLLAVTREDFITLFDQRENGQEQEHIQFLRTISNLQWLPLEKLNRRMDICMCHYFRAGVVVDRNLQASEWIYIVKTGSCKVLSKLVKPKSYSQHGRLKSLPTLKITEAERSKLANVRRGNELLPSVKDSTSLHIPSSWKSHGRRKKRSRTLNEQDIKSTLTVGQENNVNLEYAGDKKETLEIANQISTDKESYTTNSTLAANEGVNKPQRQHTGSLSSVTPQKPKMKISTGLQEHVYVQTDVLKPKDHFGLASILHQNSDEGTRYLVSNGSECILLSKNWIKTHANEVTLRTLRSQVAPVPSESTLQQNLQDKVNWEHFKSDLIRHLSS